MKPEVSIRRALLLAFVPAFFLIWLPRAVPYQQMISALWPVYHWHGLDYYFQLIDAPGVFVGSIVFALGDVLIQETRANAQAVQKIPIRIHVTGIRGKTTVTRLIGAALRHSGLRVITKTTGKDARLTDATGVESRIREHGEIPNLREQPKIIDSLSDEHIDAIVFECMSIRPRNIQAEARFVKPTISVITNVRADHLDTMGPTLEDVAWALSGINPRNGVVVTGERKYLPVITKRAEEVGATVIEAEENSVPDELLSRFPYLVFKENVAVALKVCEQLGIPKKDAVEGMLDARPDPGLTRTVSATISGHSLEFVVAFGVNDVDSTGVVFDELRRRGVIGGQNIIGLFHARNDRITRTLEFAQAMARMPFKQIVCVGEMTKLFVSETTKAGYPRERITDLGPVDNSKIINFLEEAVERMDGSVVLFGCGNMIGIEGFIREFEGMGDLTVEAR
jgi:poly-gamma-glutamate synthase PgsB/CapB